MKIAAVIVAAGLSSRMGSFKPLLPINGKPALVGEVESFLACGVSPVVVVCGHRADEVRSALDHFGGDVLCVFNPDYRGDMFLSVKRGVSSLPGDTRAFFFLPADCPAVAKATIARLMAGFDPTVGPICLPRFGPRCGHPPLLSAELIPHLLNYEGLGGLKGFMSQFSKLELSVEDPEIRRDMDTPQEYEKLLSALK